MQTTKEEYEAAFNELLGLEIKWSNLPKGDLEKLAEFFNDPARTAEVFVPIEERKTKPLLRSRLLNNITGSLVEHAMEHEGPVISALRRVAERKMEENINKI